MAVRQPLPMIKVIGLQEELRERMTDDRIVVEEVGIPALCLVCDSDFYSHAVSIRSLTDGGVEKRPAGSVKEELYQPEQLHYIKLFRVVKSK